jgi:subtilisin family serine protease
MKEDDKKYRYIGAGLIIVSLLLMLFSSTNIASNTQNSYAQSKIMSVGNLTGPVQVIIDLDVVGVQAQDVFIQAVEEQGGTVIDTMYTLDNSILTTIDASKLYALASNPNVVRIVQNQDVWFAPQEGMVTQNLADTRYQQLNVQPIWNTGLTGKGVVVAIVDTGINSQLSIFQRNGKSIIIGSQQQYGEYVMWHGTACASCVASQDPFSKGIAPGASLLNVEVFKPTGSADIWSIKKGWDWVVQWKNTHKDTPLICSNSLGADGRTSPSAVILNRYASEMMNKYNIPMVVASGNSGPGVVLCPGQSPDVLTVGAVDYQGNIASFSCSDANKPDVVAPGVSISMFDENGNPKTASGTSFSTPLTAGVAALILEQHPEYSAQQLKSVIKDSAHSVQSQSAYGSGIVDATAAVNAVPSITVLAGGSSNTVYIALIIVGVIIFFLPEIKKRKK